MKLLTVTRPDTKRPAPTSRRVGPSSPQNTGLRELREALGRSAELKELQEGLAVVSVIGAKHARRLAGTLALFLESEDPRCFWYFPQLSGQLLADILAALLCKIIASDPDLGARTKATRLLERLTES
jgi:hypothetical protein